MPIGIQAEHTDFIIVGGGSAGAALANRLTANYDPRFDWGYNSIPGNISHPVHVVHGKVLGGSSAINGAAAVRALPSDFKRWTSAGLNHWAWEDVLPYYQKMESGPFHITQPTKSEVSTMHAALINAAVEYGFKEIDDFNAGEQYGAGPLAMNIVNGQRMNTGMTYLNDAVRKRENLTIIGSALVDKVLFKDSTAYGVQLSDGKQFTANEVILSAGAYGSVQILLRSGIGPKEQLAALDIPLIAELPVGENLVEHPFYYNAYAADPNTIGRQTPVIGAQVWTKSSFAKDGELDIHITATHLLPSNQSPTKVGFVLGVALTNPQSRGTVKLASKDPNTAPIIDLNFLSVEEDRQRLLEGIHLSRQLATSQYLKPLIVKELNPANAETDDQIMTSMMTTVNTYGHPFATAPMGSPGDKNAVVDSQGNVYNVKGLRVVDASIFPDFVSSAPNPTVIMAAEKIADQIKASI